MSVRAVGDGEHDTDYQKYEEQDEAHPSKRYEGGEKTTCLEFVAPFKGAPKALFESWYIGQYHYMG